MSRCGSCGGGLNTCTCFSVNSSDVTVQGNGSASHPFQFHPDVIPEPRPFGYIQRSGQFDNIPVTTFVAVIFDSNQLGIAGGMADIVTHPTTLVASVAGIYLVGGYVDFSIEGASAGDPQIRLVKNSTTIHQNTLSTAPSAVTTHISCETLINLAVNDSIALHVSAGAGSPGGQDLIVTDSGLTTRPTLWALWVGDL